MGHLFEGDFVLGVALQAGVEDLAHAGMTFKIAGDVERVGGWACGPGVKGAHATQQQPAFERPEDGTLALRTDLTRFQ